MASPRLRRPLHLLLDWDGTLTQRDTLHLVSSIGYAHHKRHRNIHRNESESPDSQPPDPTDPPGPIDPWNEVVQMYGDDMKQHVESYQPQASERRTVEQESAWLASLEGIENRSVRRVEQAGFFRGVKRAEITEAARKATDGKGLQLREGWAELFSSAASSTSSNEDVGGQEAAEHDSKVTIISVNWSGEFIRESLLYPANTLKGWSDEQKQKVQQVVKDMTVFANEIEEVDRPEGSLGKLSKSGEKGIRTSKDKLEYMPTKDSKRGTVVYVGDSPTDFDALLAADVGICIRDEPMSSGQKELSETLERVSVKVRNISEYKASPDTNANGPTLWWARGLKEVANLIEAKG
ncbi:hypothetical protein LTR04_001442 [Oleoguttula sp. CCFEE 6159]|nr:hypothetical protein LTR04_001442 [Oleoguttula sp. CCFEE 6159]